MSDWREAARLDQLSEDAPHAANVDGRAIGLYLLDGEVRAIGDLCPHMKSVLLSQGYLEDGTIECPMHQSQFEIRTGRCLGPPADEDVPVYPVKVEDGLVLVDLG
jgi:3-phenylpropionate/trans-cinnamate dioxygenase ferredoxin component